MPPSVEGFAARLVVGPALRTQPDRRLVALIREGYENAFEEIVRRYGRPLNRYASAIVGNRAEDVTQDAFTKALLALRRNGNEIELRPWLFRIVRNTALNDLRDRPPSAEALAETIAGGRDPEEELARREELTDLMERLAALPEAQRAAIVMRELEGLSHDEIAKALGLSGGAARQAIFRARQALRDGLGLVLPLPVLKALMAGSAGAPVEAAAGAAGVGGGAAGAGVALKAVTATVLVAGAMGAGVAIDQSRHEPHHRATPSTAETRRLADHQPPTSRTTTANAGDDTGSRQGDFGRRGESEAGDDHGHRTGGGEGHGEGSGPGSSRGGALGGDQGSSGGHGGANRQIDASDDHGGGGNGPSGDGGSGERRSGGGDDGGSTSGDSSGGTGGSSGSGDGSNGGDGSSGDSGSGESTQSGIGEMTEASSGSDSTSSNSGDSGDSLGDGGFYVQTEPQTQEEP